MSAWAGYQSSNTALQIKVVGSISFPPSSGSTIVTDQSQHRVQKEEEISTAALKKTCPVCQETMDVFLEIIGAEAAAMGLRCMATGGIFVAGGIPPKILPAIENGALKKAFLNEQGRFKRVIETFPLFVCKKEIGMEGTFQYALSVVQGRR
jgi:glucokinase